jgi:hypothetical protein
MGNLAFIDIFGYWLGIFLTFCILSFLYKDNPFYKTAEHLFIGVSIGYVVTKQYFDTVKPSLMEPLFERGEWRYVIPLLLGVMLLCKLWRRSAWAGRWPIAFIVGLYAGININGVAQGDLIAQAQKSMESVAVDKINVNEAGPEDLSSLPGMTKSISERVIARRAREPLSSLDDIAELPGVTEPQRRGLAEARGDLVGLDARATVSGHPLDWFGTLSKVLLLLGTIASLVYFYYSTEQKGLIGHVSRVGVWVLMIGFGASFGYTVQARIALAIGRAMDVLGTDKDAGLAAQIDGPRVAVFSLSVIVAGIMVWEWLARRRPR